MKVRFNITLSFFTTLPITVLLIHSCKNGVEANNILFFHMMGTTSHRTSIWPLAEKLANVGHNVTYIFPLPRQEGFRHPAIEEITPSKVVPILEENIKDYDINFRLNNSNHLLLQNMFEISFDLCEAFYESPEVHEWINRPNLHYDLVMIDSSMGECIYGVVHRFNAKHIIIAPAMVPHIWDGFGIIPESSSIPPIFKFYSGPVKPSEMNLYGRLMATLEPLLWRLRYNDFVNKVEHLIANRMNISDLPHLREFEMNTSLVLVNSHFVEDYPMSLPPMFQSYSGLWCSKEKMKDRKSLSVNLEKFVGGKESDGFIYISFGSAISAVTMPTELRKSIFDSIAAFPRLRFLWKWVGPDPVDKPENLLLQKWFSQHDVLGHPKIKGFMTQSGRPSTQEALCHGVPLITLPIVGDQDYNAGRLEYIGAAINLDIATLTAKQLKEAFQDIAYNQKRKERMNEISKMFRDRPLDPLENALYWTEYVLRHDTSLMKPLGINQSWFQRRLLDVYLAIVGAILAISGFAVIGIYVISKLALNHLTGPEEESVEERKARIKTD